MTINVKSVGISLLAAVAAVSTLLHARRSQTATQIPAPTVVRIDKTPDGIAYKVNSKPTGHTATTDILRALNLINEERGANAPVVVLVDDHVSFAEVWNFEGVAGKAQLNNLRFFVFNRESEKMSELKWGPTVPFSTHPN